jgi:hypothetical protein
MVTSSLSASAPMPLPPRERRLLWVFFAGATVAFFLFVGLGVYNLFTLTTDARALRRELLATDSNLTMRIEGTVGPVLLGTAGMVLRFIPDAPPEAHEALAAMRSVSAGVYGFSSRPTAEERADVFGRADAAMEQRGWMRVVGVADKGTTVAVYVPAAEEFGEEIRVCVAVFDQKQLVLVAGRADADKVVTFAQRQIPKHLRL